MKKNFGNHSLTDVWIALFTLLLLGIICFIFFDIINNKSSPSTKSQTGYMSVLSQYNKSIDDKSRLENSKIPDALVKIDDQKEQGNVFVGNFSVSNEGARQARGVEEYKRLSPDKKKNIDLLLQRFFHCKMGFETAIRYTNLCSNFEEIENLAEEIFTRFPFLVMQRKYFFNHPEEMQVGDRIQITFAIGQEMNSVRKKFAESFQSQIPGKVQKGSIITSYEMSAELSGKDFNITPMFSQNERFVPITATAEWSWSIEALHPPGENKLITLKVYARQDTADESDAPMVIETLRARMSVDVSIFEWIYSIFIGPLVVISPILGGFVWIIQFIIKRYRSENY
jgi:hypothetical protein